MALQSRQQVQAGCSSRPCCGRLPPSRAQRVNPIRAVGQAASAVRAPPKEIKVEVDETSWSSRRLFARVGINAPVEIVWGCLTDYDRLAEFIPSLVENKCIEKRKNGALLRQVGSQDLPMGVKFSAVCTLECTEFMTGVPASFCSTSGNGSDGLLPAPRNSLPHVPVRDIAFVQTDGDFKAFRGIWRLQPGHSGSTILYYSLFVQPQAWLPVKLIQNRIEREVTKNLQAVAVHSEHLYYRQTGTRPNYQL